MAPEQQKKASRDFATLLALGFLIAIGVALWLFISSVMQAFLGVFVLVGFFVLMTGFHYFVWGKWLTAKLQREQGEIGEDLSRNSRSSTGDM